MSAGYGAEYAVGEYEGGNEWPEEHWGEAEVTAYVDSYGGDGAESTHFDESHYSPAAYEEHGASSYEVSGDDATRAHELENGGYHWPEEAYEEPYQVDHAYEESNVEDLAYHNGTEYADEGAHIEGGVAYHEDGNGEHNYGEEEGDDWHGHEDLPSGWEAKYDDSMGANYYLNEVTGEASWVRPEEINTDNRHHDDGSPKREKWETAAKATYDYNEVSRTYNPKQSFLSSTGQLSLLSTQRPRCTPVAVRALPPDVVEKVVTTGADELHSFSLAKQEEVRLRIFNEHLKKQSKSALAGRRKLKHEVKLPPDAKRPTTPEKREEMRNKTTREMSKARRDLAAAKAYHEQKALARKAALQQGATTSSVAINNRSESAEAVDPEVWLSNRWPIGPKGYAHPPAAQSVGELEQFGERALVAAWRKRVPPPPSEANRFALGVESPRRERLPPPIPDKAKQKFSPEMDHYALLYLYYDTAGESWRSSTGWKDELHGRHPPGTHKNWFGCHPYNTLDQRVASLVMPGNNLCGQLPEAFQWLDRLKNLNLTNNALTGPLSPSYSTMTTLATLDLSSNQLTGVIHERFFEGMHRNRDPNQPSQKGLRSLNLSHNQLWGEVPYSLSTLQVLTNLNFAHNQLSQQLPEGLSCCTALKILRLSDNKFTGSLPNLVNLSHLVVFEAADNDFDGQVPPLPLNLSKLHMQGNKLVRDLPLAFFACTQLADVNLNDNYLSGAISDSVGDLTALRLLKLEGNRHSDTDKDVIKDCVVAYLPELVKRGGFAI